MLKWLRSRWIRSSGIRLVKAGKYREARQRFEAIRKLYPDSYDSHSLDGWSWMCEQSYEDAIRSFDKALQFKTDFAYAHAQLGIALGQMGRDQEALESLSRALRIEPKYESKVDHLLALAATCARLNQAGRSCEYYERALKIAPDSFNCIHGLGWAYCNWDRYEEAEPLLRKAVNLQPNNADAHHLLGVTLWGLERWEEAIAEFENELSIRPENADCLLSLGVTHIAAGHHADAIPALERAVEIDPSDFGSWLNLWVATGEVGRWGDALAAALKCREIRPNDIVSYFALSSAYSELGRFDEALEAAEQACKLDPTSVVAVETVAWTYLKKGDLTRCLEIAKCGTLSSKSVGQILAGVASTLFDMGKVDAAMEHYDAVKKMDTEAAQWLEDFMKGKQPQS